ncbi:phage virion morphogenesis protein [Tenacibaculum finnmarkense]|uniref:phage virion morphogenesis protein n=1 Tax=Tenacibaculum finnmarkense TaxID=2781243 RepID=UPI000C42CDFF|nr:phage virion morphogenesis protein [Tenacibaculum finnmarkense]MCD8440857.1 phage virion morphogenesis protein [Tenacibaculum finnmarkense genomovar ulcerans]MCG8208394.1 phage virion morphogenesis protein [Tenacibaculum finnmarkense genomovar finnmarkense]MCG8253268.1 phage virion morphogenesis protein [Tenacibaculum finnmarkense genomovar finnmarkense]MCG8721773.1 hypothetical protein [Tenacibaculum finnmarkense]MCG8816636.1 hypothetical protein [Tenacibaculum finnmarkense]
MSVNFRGDFFEKLQRINNKLFLSKMTSEAGVIAVKFSKDRFRQSQKNWVDTSQEKWTPRKRKRAGSLLVGPGSGRLKKSIRKISEGKYYVLIGTDVPYAQIHNEGGTIKTTARVRAHSRTRKGRSQLIKVKAHTRQMNTKIPKRQFLGESAVLARRLENHMYDKVTDEIYKK